MKNRLATATLVWLLCAPVTALGLPHQLNVQGALRTSGGGPAPDGSYGATIALYDGAGANAATLYSEAHPNLQVTGGAFNALIGSVAPEVNPLPIGVFAADSLWVGVAIAGDPELPRQPLAAVPWAFRALSADTLSCSGCVSAAHLGPDVAESLATALALSDYALASDLPDLTPYAKVADLPDLGPYAKLADLPDLGPYAKQADLAAVAKSGSYADLADVPAIPTVNIQAVEQALAPGESLEVAHGGDTLDVLLSAYVLRGGVWTVVGDTEPGVDPAGHLIHWSFDACDGNDSSGSAYHGTVQGGLECVDGRFGKGLRWPHGSFQHVRAAMDQGLAGIVQQHTISAWVKYETLSESAVIWSLDDGTNKHIVSIGTDEGLTVHWAGGTNAVSMGSAPAGVWTHVAATYDGAVWTLLLNGSVVATQAGQPKLALGAGNCFMVGEDQDTNCGGGADADSFKGTIDEVHVFSRVLTGAEVTKLMNDKVGFQAGGVPITLPDANTARLTNDTLEAGTYRLVVLRP